MTNKDLEDLINKMNNHEDSHLIFPKKLNENVEVAIVWPEEPKLKEVSIDTGSHRCFFIKNPEKYIGIISDMGNDLHTYMSPEYRKQGYMTKALEESVLPYIFEELEREEQILTTSLPNTDQESFNSINNIAKKLGFTTVSDNSKSKTFILHRNNFDFTKRKITKSNYPMDEERMNQLRKEVFLAYRMLHKISDELLMKFDDDRDLSDTVKLVRRYTQKIDNLYFDYLGQQT